MFSSVCARANDGSFRAEGNQLIPMYETDISVKKEILTISRLNATNAIINVYYEFFNPKEDKELEVGFEAYSPSGDVDARPVNGRHPYISGFSILMNGEKIPYKVAIVGDSLYFKNGIYKTKTKAEILKGSEDADDVDFFYVYHFRAPFRKGLNIIHHSYIVELSSSVSEDYSLSYVLTAAGRWANRQIDDFTLNIDMGDFQDIRIEPGFFKSSGEWEILGKGKQTTRKASSKYEMDMPEFFMRHGSLRFQKKNFTPTDEFHMKAYNNYLFGENSAANERQGFDSKFDALPFSIIDQDQIQKPVNDLSRTILKNLPYARRGYVFKNPELKAYYSKQLWWLPDPAYTPDRNLLTEKEKIWLSHLQDKSK